MRKAKIMFTTLVLVFAASSLFAFKASNFAQNLVYTGVLGSGKCQTQTPFRVIVCSGSGTPNMAASTTSLATGCPNARVMVVDVDN